MALIGHESRQVDGYVHISCCGTPNGCDQTYNENDLSSYGIVYYLPAPRPDWQMDPQPRLPRPGPRRLQDTLTIAGQTATGPLITLN